MEEEDVIMEHFQGGDKVQILPSRARKASILLLVSLQLPVGQLVWDDPQPLMGTLILLDFGPHRKGHFVPLRLGSPPTTGSVPAPDPAYAGGVAGFRKEGAFLSLSHGWLSEN